MVRSPLRSLLPLFCLFPSVAGAWPADDAAWTPLTVSGAVVEDLVDDAHFEGDPTDDGDDVSFGPQCDIVGTAPDAAGYWSVDESYLYFRMRINADPSPGWADGGVDFVSTFAILLDTDGLTTSPEFSLLLYKDLAAVVEVGQLDLFEFAPDALWTDIPVAPPLVEHSDPFADSRARHTLIDLNSAGFDGDDDAWIDISISRLDFEEKTGLTEVDPFQVALATGAENLYNTYVWSDLARADNSGAISFEDGLLDAIYIDEDDDGLLYPEELAAGTNPSKSDSDDDGISDRTELETTLTDPTDEDSDGDTLLDGEEVDTWHTDPNLTDTDGDGLDDNTELHVTGTDPIDADTDDDTIEDLEETSCDLGGTSTDRDGDGHPDLEEAGRDDDGDGRQNFCDDDDDGDDIPTATEGEEDPDLDTIPNYLDDNSDGDGRSDLEEGTADDDCDNLDNYVDANDADGPCADGGGDGDGGGNGGNADGTDEGSLKGLAGGNLTGGTCSTMPRTPGLFLVLAAGALLLGRRRSPRALPLVVRLGSVSIGALLGSSGEAAAQEIDAQRFHPNIDGQTFVVVDDPSLGAAGLSGGLFFNDARDLFQYRYDDPSRSPVAVLDHVATTDLLAAYTWGPIRFGLDTPLHLSADGLGVSDVGSYTLGDIRFDGKVQLLDRRIAPVGLALSGNLALPTGNGRAWLGAPGTSGGGRLSLAVGRSWVASGVIGYESVPHTDLLGTGWGSSLGWGLAFATPTWLQESMWVTAELDGDKVFDAGSDPGAAPVEALVALHGRPVGELLLTGGFGRGLSSGIGAPDRRLVFGIRWSPRPKPGIMAVAGSDGDGDGVPSPQDLCPDQAEDRNGQIDDDGCPEKGLTPTLIEVWDQEARKLARSTVQLSEGPETGTWATADGVVGHSLPPGTYTLRCSAPGYRPAVKEIDIPAATTHSVACQVISEAAIGRVVLTVRDEGGAPLDAKVRVPASQIELGSKEGVTTIELPAGHHTVIVTAPGFQLAQMDVELSAASQVGSSITLHPIQAFTGTGMASEIRMVGDYISIPEMVFFETGSSSLTAAAFPLLEQLIAFLHGHPEIHKIEIRGHADKRGSAEVNHKLSQRRADAVAIYLVSRDAPKWIEYVPIGYGESKPIQIGEEVRAMEANRRVDFVMIRDSQEGATP